MSKRKNKWILVPLLALMIVLLTACSEKNADVDNTVSGSSDSYTETEGNDIQASEESDLQSGVVESDGYAKFSQLEIGMTESDVREILGEPAEVDKAYHYYNIIVNGQEMEIQVWINTVSGLVTYFGGNFEKDEYRAEFVDSKTDLSAAEQLDSGELSTYDECVSAFKTSGYLISLNEDGEARYLWVDSNDGHLCITFSSDGNVKSYVGYC